MNPQRLLIERNRFLPSFRCLVAPGNVVQRRCKKGVVRVELASLQLQVLLVKRNGFGQAAGILIRQHAALFMHVWVCEWWVPNVWRQSFNSSSKRSMAF